MEENGREEERRSTGDANKAFDYGRWHEDSSGWAKATLTLWLREEEAMAV